MTTRETLAAAHRHMSPDEIADHALLLAEYVEQQAGLIAGLLEFVESLRRQTTVAEAYGIATMTAVRRVQSLVTRGQKAEAMKLLGRLASEGPADRSPDPIDLAELRAANVLPASLFDPVTTQPQEAS